MNREETKGLFKFLSDVYSQKFKIDSGKLDTWTRMLSDQENETVMKHAERYAKDNQFPPSIADLRKKDSPANSRSFLQKDQEWKDEALGYVPMEKPEFIKKLEQEQEDEEV